MDTQHKNNIDNEENKDYMDEDAKNKAIEKVKQKATIVNVEEIAEAEARKAADAYMTESKERQKGIKGWCIKMWKHTFFDEYYRQREINRAREEIKNTGNIYSKRLGKDDKVAHENAMKGISDRFVSEYEGTLSDGEQKKILDEKDPETVKAKNDIKKLINDYASNSINEDVFKSEKNKIVNSLKNEDLLKGANNYADNLFEIAQNARLAIEHGAKLEELDYDLDIIVGKAKSSLKTEAHFNWVDKGIDKMKKSKIGRFISPAVLSTAVGIAYSISVGMGKKVLSSKAAAYGTFGAAVAVSSLFAAANESQRVALERAQHGIEMAEGGEFEKGSKRREQLEKYEYQMESSNDLAKKLRDLMFEKDKDGKDVVKDIKKEDLDKIFASLSDIEARNSLNSKNRIDLISYSNIGNVEKERTDLTILTARAKVELRKKIEGDFKDADHLKGKTFDDYLAEQTRVVEDSLLGGEKGITSQDKAFRKYKAKRVGKKVLQTVIAGLVIGGTIQEGIAFFKDDVQGLAEGIFHHDGSAITQTPLENAYHYITGNPSHMGMGNAVDHIVGGHNFKLPDGISMIQNSDGTFDVLRGDQVISDNIPLTFDANGNLDPDSLTRLGEDGIIANTIHNIVDETKEVMSDTQDWIHDHQGKTINIQHVEKGPFMDNNTPMIPDPTNANHLLGADGNETGMNWGGINGSGVNANGDAVLNISHMDAIHSVHGDISVDVPKEMNDGNLMAIIYPDSTCSADGVGIPVQVGVNGDIIFDHNDPIMQQIFKLDENGQMVSHAKVIELVQNTGIDENGITQVRAISAIVGEGLNKIQDVVPTHIDTPITSLSPSLDVEPPMFIPFVARSPLEPIKYKDFNENGPGYYGYGESGNYGLLDRKLYKERLSKNLQENSEYDLSGNDSEIINDYLSQQDKKYMKELELILGSNSKMGENIETVITVPAYQEGKNIEKTIRNYAKLKNRETFELVILENHPSTKERDETGEVISKMKEEYPDMNIIHLYKTFDKKPTIGEVRKYLVDSVLVRKQNSNIDRSIAIVSNDADLEDISENYANDISKSFKENKKLDAIGGKWDYKKEDFEKFPVFHSAQRLWHYFDIVFRNNYLNSPELIGRNSAFRSGVYAAIGGYNKDAKLAEDLEIGWMIKEARKYDSSRISYLNKASLVSNSRRAVGKMLSEGRLVEQYGDFHENEEIRGKSIDELLKDKKDFDIETFKKEAQSIYNHYSRWKKSNNGWIDDHFVDQTFDRAMRFLGVKYEKSADSIIITDTSKLMQGLNKKKEVIKSDDEQKPSPEKKSKEKIPSDSLKKVISSKLEGNAKIENLNLNFNGDKLEINTDLNAGIIGGKIKIKGSLENSDDNIVIGKDLNIEARGWVKNDIENSLSKLIPEIKKYFEDEYKQEIKSMKIEDGGLTLNFKE